MNIRVCGQLFDKVIRNGYECCRCLIGPSWKFQLRSTSLFRLAEDAWHNIRICLKGWAARKCTRTTLSRLWQMHNIRFLLHSFGYSQRYYETHSQGRCRRRWKPRWNDRAYMYDERLSQLITENNQLSTALVSYSMAFQKRPRRRMCLA